VLEAEAAACGLEMARRYRPDLIILDLEVEPVADVNLPEVFAQHTRQGSASLIVPDTALEAGQGEFVSKPYH
jgi:hypothetical protein